MLVNGTLTAATTHTTAMIPPNAINATNSTTTTTTTSGDLAAFLAASSNCISETVFGNQINLNDAATLFSLLAQQQQQALLQRLQAAQRENSRQKNAIQEKKRVSYQ